jgi:hypothetical protein
MRCILVRRSRSYAPRCSHAALIDGVGREQELANKGAGQEAADQVGRRATRFTVEAVKRHGWTRKVFEGRASEEPRSPEDWTA